MTEIKEVDAVFHEGCSRQYSIKNRYFYKGAFCILTIILCTTFSKVIAQPIRIMTYNIHNGSNADDEPTIPQMAELIEQANLDIVGLVEVDSVCDRSGKVDQPAKLAKMTNMHSAFVRHFPFQGGAYGVALLSHYPISDVKNMRLPIMTNENGDTTRAALFARLLLPDNRKALVVVVHLDYRSEASRLKQVAVLQQLLKDESGPVFILGDFNFTPESKPMKFLTQNFIDANSSNSNTFPGTHPAKKIDYIMVDRRHYLKTLEDKVYPHPFSDHLAIVAELELKKDRNNN